MSDWMAGWGYRETDFSLFPIFAENETQRLWFCHNLNADRMRLRFSNRYGRETLPLKRVTAALCSENGELIPDTSVIVCFDGMPEAALTPGEVKYCDPIPLPTKLGDWVSVSLYIEVKTRITGAISSQANLVTRMACQKGGNYCEAARVSGERFMDNASGFMALKPLYNVVAVGLTQAEFWCERPESVTTVIAFGDSITQHGNWSEALTRRLYQAAPGRVTVVNRGICGNRVLHDASIRSKFGGYFGEGGLERFEADVYQTPGGKVDWVIVEEGVNDIIQPYDHTCPQYEKVTAEEVLAGYGQMAAMAHERGTQIIGSTLMPFKGFNAVWNDASEGMRQAINAALLKGGLFDAVTDFARVVQDRAEPEKMADALQCGDHLHPNVKGGQALADSVDIAKIIKP